MLKKHIKILNNNHKKNLDLLNQFRFNMEKHLKKMDSHSDEVETKLMKNFKQICDPLINEQQDNKKRIKRESSQAVKKRNKITKPINT